ncbi:hypothetical protein BDZ94DRAFT_1353722 [Collybia nuda]|uniref:N-acetyltransferase domain-containing protein n=1 Tax=Collybia nuda TaxID=64659 RepID=A0A9P6CCE9_9AGAR|nr:hypothetical protein BDZ94DRAFT_1353722 [Collybia nuda]
MATSTPETLSVRLAKPEEFDKIAASAREAFIHDPVFNYFGGHKELLPKDGDTVDTRNLETFFKFLLKSCHRVGGQIAVTVKSVETATPGVTEEKIVAGAFWCPPNKRLALWRVPTLVQSGIVEVLRRWGFSALMRVGFEYLDQSHAGMSAGYKAKGVKQSPDASWYLQLVWTEPAHQGQGIMPLMVHDAIAKAKPGIPFTLEATTSASRDRYLHLGFEEVYTINLGKGKVNALGIPASGAGAVGVSSWSMINWDPKPLESKS